MRWALAGDWPTALERPTGELALVCRPDLDVYSGLAGLYRTRHGNLRTDGVAAGYGDATGLGVHLYPESVRYLWLDRALRPGTSR